MVMTDTKKASKLADDLPKRLKRVERLAFFFDSKFSIPFTSIRLGWDSLIGLIPGVGDAATLIPQVYLLYQGWRVGVSKRVLLKIVVNVGIDVLAGAVPIVGDLFDVAFKSNIRNAKLISTEIKKKQASE